MKFRRIHPLVWTIVIGTFFARLSTSMSYPFLAIYLTKALHISSSTTGIIIGASAFAGLMFSFFGGNLSDRYGRKYMIFFSVVVWVFVFIGFSKASLGWHFLILNTLNGICRSIFEPSTRALISDFSHPKDKMIAFNLRYGAVNAGVAFGPLLGLALGSATSMNVFMYAGIIFAIYGTVLMLQLNRYGVTTANSQSTGLSMRASVNVLASDQIFTMFLFASIFTQFGYSQFMTSLPQYFANNPLMEDGTRIFASLLTLNAVTVLMAQVPVMKFAKKTSPIQSIILGVSLLSVNVMIVGLVTSTWGLVILMIIFTIGEVLVFSMSDVFLDSFAKKELRGTYFGTMGLAAIGSVVGPIMAGYLFDYFGFKNGSYVFLICGFISCFSIPLFMKVKQVWLKSSPDVTNNEVTI